MAIKVEVEKFYIITIGRGIKESKHELSKEEAQELLEQLTEKLK